MICSYCHSQFSPKNSRQKYCSNACRLNDWISNHPDRSYEIKQKYRLAHPEQYAAYAAQYREKYPVSPEKHAARHAIEHGIRAGKIERPTTCSQCGKEGKIEAHHHLGYDPEYRLDVVWLCGKCHSQADRKAYDLANAARE